MNDYPPVRVLVTGSDGFIGKALVNYIDQMFREDIIATVPFDLSQGKNILHVFQLEKDIKNCDVIFHIAAQADLYKMQTYEGALEGSRVNIVGTLNIAQLCAKYKKRLIYASTCCVYGNHIGKEVCPNPSELYAYTKLAGEEIIKGWAKNFCLDYTILRFGTVYGPGMRASLGVRVFIEQALNKTPFTIHGNGLQTRQQIYIDDLVTACAQSIVYHRGCTNTTLNIAGNKKITALQMALDIKRLMGSTNELVLLPDRPNQTFDENIDISLAQSNINWTPSTLWLDGLQETINWVTAQHIKSKYGEDSSKTFVNL